MKPISFEIWTHDSLDQQFEKIEEVKKYFQDHYAFEKIEKLNPEYWKEEIKQGFTHICDWHKGSKEYPGGNYCEEDFSLIKPIYTCGEPSEEDPDVLAERLYNY